MKPNLLNIFISETQSFFFFFAIPVKICKSVKLILAEYLAANGNNAI